MLVVVVVVRAHVDVILLPLPPTLVPLALAVVLSNGTIRSATIAGSKSSTNGTNDTITTSDASNSSSRGGGGGT